MTPESLVRHELAGLDVSVEASPNPDLVGLAGRVVDETTNTLLVATGGGVKRVPKAAATFRFRLDDCEAPRASNTSSAEHGSARRSSGRSPREDGDEPRVDVVVDGERLVARPARRTELEGGSLWQ